MASVFKDHSACYLENGLRESRQQWWEECQLEGCWDHLGDVIGLTIQWQQWVVVNSGCLHKIIFRNRGNIDAGYMDVRRRMKEPSLVV